jgi:hypothetical protein
LRLEITEAQYERIKVALPVQRGNVRLSNLQVLNAVPYVLNRATNGAVFRSASVAGTPVYTRMKSLVEEQRSASVLIDGHRFCYP